MGGNYMQENKAFEEFVTRKCSELIDENVSKEEMDRMVFAYKQGFIDAVNILDTKHVFEIKIYT